MSVEVNWYIPEIDRSPALEFLVRNHGVVVTPADFALTDHLLERVGESVDALFLTLMNAMDQDDGFVAGMFTGDVRENYIDETAALLAADILRAGGTGDVPSWDRTPSSDLGKVVGLGELDEADVKAAVDGYLTMLAGQAGVPETAFGTGTRHQLVRDMMAYVALEGRYAEIDKANEASSAPSP